MEETSKGEQTSSEEPPKSEDKQLKILFAIIGGLLALVLIIYLIFYSVGNFEYRNIDFKIIHEGDLIFYNTAFPYKDSITGEYIGNYNFYIRNDPRKLDKEIPFDGELNLLRHIVLNSTESFNCNGDGIIAVQNMANLLGKVGANVIKDENATCDSKGMYTYILLQPGNKTEIKQVGPSCYNLNINNCEILEVTERFMTETFVKIKEAK